jgi:hypothetical protein
VTLSASVTSGGVGVDEGTVTFTILQFGNYQLGLPVVSGLVSAGVASVNFTLPGGLPPGGYYVQALYLDNGLGSSYQPSSDFWPTLTVGLPQTSTAVLDAAAPFSAGSQTVTLSATVDSAGVGVNEGTVTFTVVDSQSVQIGSQLAGGAV